MVFEAELYDPEHHDSYCNEIPNSNAWCWPCTKLKIHNGDRHVSIMPIGSVAWGHVEEKLDVDSD